MANRIDAKDAVKDLAAAGLSTSAIQKKLTEKGFGGLLDKAEVEMIVTQARAVMNLKPRRSSHFWPRLIGVIAIVMGFYLGRTLGAVAIVLGILLVIMPSLAGDKV
jgi:hypothetical protein